MAQCHDCEFIYCHILASSDIKIQVAQCVVDLMMISCLNKLSHTWKRYMKVYVKIKIEIDIVFGFFFSIVDLFRFLKYRDRFRFRFFQISRYRFRFRLIDPALLSMTMLTVRLTLE